MRKNVYIAKLIFHKGAKTIKDENFALLIESLKQATDYKNGNKDAARSLIRDTDDMGVGCHYPTKEEVAACRKVTGKGF